MTQMVLRTEGLVKKYGKRTVVNQVAFEVKQGEIVGLLGPNGAGKTTSFYMTTGLVVPNAGHIYLNDREITDYRVQPARWAQASCDLYPVLSAALIPAFQAGVQGCFMKKI